MSGKISWPARVEVCPGLGAEKNIRLESSKLTFVQHLAKTLMRTWRGKERRVVEGRIKGRREGLAAGNQSPPPASAIPVIVFVTRVALNNLLHDLLDIADLNQDVLGLQVGVDDAAFPVEVVQTQQHLLRDLFDEGHGDSSVVPPFDQTQEILPQHLEDHADVGSVGALVLKRVQEADDVLAAGVVGIRLDDLIKELDLVDGGLGVVGG